MQIYYQDQKKSRKFWSKVMNGRNGEEGPPKSQILLNLCPKNVIIDINFKRIGTLFVKKNYYQHDHGKFRKM